MLLEIISPACHDLGDRLVVQGWAGDPGSVVALISEVCGFRGGLSSSTRRTHEAPWVSLHVELLQFLGLWGDPEPMTGRDTGDLDATPRCCDGSHTGPLGSGLQASTVFQIPQEGPHQGQRTPPETAHPLGAQLSWQWTHETLHNACLVTGLTLLWDGVRGPGAHRDTALTVLSACESEPISVQGSGSAPTLWSLVSLSFCHLSGDTETRSRFTHEPGIGCRGGEGARFSFPSSTGTSECLPFACCVPPASSRHCE